MDNRSWKVRVIAVSVFFLPLFSVFGGEKLRLLQRNAETFQADLIKSMPLHAGLGLNWSDAYIGQLLSVRPHLGIGVSAGVSSGNHGSFENFMNSFGVNVSQVSSNMFLLPAGVVDIRLGGLVLPFDLGFKIGKIDDFKMDTGMTLYTLRRSYVMYGGDLRYALVKGGASLPKVSLGFGYTYLEGAVHTSMNGSRDFEIDSSKILTANDPSLAVFWNASVLDLKLHVSKTLAVFTPYLGLAASFYWADAGYKLKGPLTYNGGSWQNIENDMAAAGISGITLNQEEGFSSSSRDQGASSRVYGGFSMNFFVFRLDLTAFCAFPHFGYGGSLGIRVQV
jgi:hypothetical protein